MAARRGQKPKRIGTWIFWVSWIAVTLVAGLVAGYIYALPNRVACFHIGLSLPLLVEHGAKAKISVYWIIEEFKLFEKGKPRFAIRLMMFIAALSAAGLVACFVFKLC